MPTGDNLAAALTGHAATVELSFSAVENHGGDAVAGIPAATFTPSGGGAAVDGMWGAGFGGA